MIISNCLYCKGSKTEKSGKCSWCSGTGKMEFRFDTCKEVEEWQKEHPIKGLYGDNRLWLGCCREELEIYLESYDRAISWQDIYDDRHGILRFEI